MSMNTAPLESLTARPLAPEDVVCGQYVSIRHTVGEYLPCPDSAEPWKTPRIVRVEWLPGSNAPMKVLEVCVPFVLVKLPNGRPVMLDTRRYRLLQLAPRFGREAWKRLRAAHRRRAREQQGPAA